MPAGGNAARDVPTPPHGRGRPGWLPEPDAATSRGPLTSPGRRRERILRYLVGDGSDEVATDRLCAACAVLTGASGAGIMLMSDQVSHGSLCATNPVSALIEQVQYSLGEGPCVDAYRHDRPTLEPDLARPDTVRWLGFTGPVVAAGVAAVFGFPLRVGAVRLGALNLYRDRPGHLTDDQHADALVLADVAAEAVLLLQAQAPLGALAHELDRAADFHPLVHQATGMVAVQLGTSVAQAAIRLRGYAFGNGRPLQEVARDVVGRRVRFDPGEDAGVER